MGLLDILNQYTGSAQPRAETPDHFEEAARQAPSSDIAGALSAMFHSSATPPFEQQVGQLFGRSNPQQQAGVLNQIIQALGPAALGAAGGVLGRIVGTSSPATASGAAPTSAQATPSVTPEQASQLSPAQVQDIAAHAQQHDPSIVERLGSFYAEHPTLVKSLGGAALAVALGHMRSKS